MSDLKGLFTNMPDTQDVTIRPLDKGIVLNLPSQLIPAGGFFVLKNYQATTQGLRRRSNYSVFIQGVFEGDPIDLVTLWGTGGTQKTYLITTKYLYSVSALGGVIPIYFKEVFGTIDVSGTSVTGHGTRWVDIGIKPGDVLVVGSESAVVGSVGANTDITLASADITDATGLSYEIRRVFGAEVPYLVDWQVANDLLVIATILNPPLYVGFGDAEMHELIRTERTVTATVTSGSTVVTDVAPAYVESTWKGDPVSGTGIPNGAVVDSIASLSSFTLSAAASASGSGVNLLVGLNHYASTGRFSAETAAFFNDALWFGHTISALDGEKRYQVRWSTVLDITNFADYTAYYDIPYQTGRLKKLLPMGETLIAYFDDAIYVGKKTNIPNLPVEFDPYPTGGIGLVGMYAVTAWLDGHFFVGQDDIYFFSNRGLQKIGTPIVRETIKKCQNIWRIMSAVDPQRQRIVFGFPEVNESYTKVWSFDYVAKAWSYEEINGVGSFLLSNPIVNSTVTWSELNITWDGPEIAPYSWDALSSKEEFRSLYRDNGADIIRMSDLDEGLDMQTTIIEGVIETGDFDFGATDTNKLYKRLSIKIDRDSNQFDETVSFLMYGSANRGKSWKALGTLAIPVDEDEGYITFRMTGSTCRFRFISTDAVKSYIISEMTLRVTGVGLETGLYKQSV